MSHMRAAVGEEWRNEDEREETPTAPPRAARGVAPVHTSALLSLVPVSSSLSVHSATHSNLFSFSRVPVEQKGWKSGGWSKVETEEEEGGFDK